MLLGQRDLCVCQLMGVLGISQPLISRNLSLLKQAGILDERREGKLMFYSLRKDLDGFTQAVVSTITRELRDDRTSAEDMRSLKECTEFQKKSGKCDMQTFLAYMGKEEGTHQGGDRMLAAFRRKRSKLQAFTWFGLPLVVIGGWFYPLIGLLLLGCMAGALGVALYKGRAWCDWMCPRGSFYDLFLSRWSRNRRVPDFVKTRGFSLGVLAALFAVLGTQVYYAWGEIEGIGMAMVRVLTVTTTIGIVFGLIYQERFWCHICPMGTLSNFLSSGKQPLTITEGCVSCKLCAKVCPKQLTPYVYKTEGQITDRDCIKCGTCVSACPKKVLNFEEKSLRKAA